MMQGDKEAARLYGHADHPDNKEDGSLSLHLDKGPSFLFTPLLSASYHMSDEWGAGLLILN